MRASLDRPTHAFSQPSTWAAFAALLTLVAVPRLVPRLVRTAWLYTKIAFFIAMSTR
jgi:hypothetical protein